LLVDEDTRRQRLAEIDKMTADARQVLSATTAALAMLGAERLRLLAQNPAPRAPAKMGDKHNWGE
jgi:hypothetical protein